MRGPIDHADLLTRRPEPATSPEHRQAEKRRGTCGHPLASDNPGPLCSACQGKADAERIAALPVHRLPPRKPEVTFAAAAVARERQTTHGGPMDDRPARSIQPIPGVTLTPARLPSGRSGRDWGAVIEAFLASGENCMAVEATGVKAAKSLCASIHPATKDKPVRASVRNDKCYLVRKGVTK